MFKNLFICFVSIICLCCSTLTWACNTNLTPTLECVVKKSNTSYVAYFGYNNTSSSTINVSVGSWNYFNPTPQNRGQPTSFSPGKKSYVFSVPFNGSNLSWLLESGTVTASSASKACVIDCKGVVNGTSVVDKCGICGGDNSTCKDCKGVVNGAAVVDKCGICGGDNSTCKDCLGIPNGTAKTDSCGVCDTNTSNDNQTCLGCDGVPNSHLVYDACGVCNGNNSTCSDCAGVPNGSAKIDECGVCKGNNNACLDCAGTPNGTAKVDVCGVCNGNGTSCLDCAGVPNGSSKLDSCKVCNGDNTKCADCAGTPNGITLYDVCGVCGGNGTSCLDCAGIPNGLSHTDLCGVCNGTNNCLDCNNTPNGGKVIDSCGICGGNGGKETVLKISKKKLIKKLSAIVNDVIRFYISIGQRCKSNWGKDLETKTNSLNKKTTVLIQNLVTKVMLCPGQCAKDFNRSSIRKIKKLLEQLYQLSREVRSGAVTVCHGSGGSWKDSKSQFDSFKNDINKCPNHVCHS